MQAKKNSRAGNRRKAKKEIPGKGTGFTTEPEDLEDFEEFNQLTDLPDLTSEDLPQGSDSLLYSYLQRNELLDNEYQITLYKYDREHGESKTYCERWTGEIPNEDLIGRQYGGGRFVLILQLTDKNGKQRGTTRKFRLHQRYDKIASAVSSGENNSFPMVSMSGNQGGGNGGNQLNDAVKLIQVMIGTFLPVIKMFQANMTPPAQQAPPEMPGFMGDMMKENYKMMNDTMQELFADNTQFFNDMQRKDADLPETTEDETETSGVVGMLNQILPMIDKFLPLITTRGSQGMQTVETIKKLPGFNKVIQDKKMIKQLIKFISEKHGPDVARQVLRKFKVRNPDAKPQGRPPANRQKKPGEKKPAAKTPA